MHEVIRDIYTEQPNENSANEKSIENILVHLADVEKFFRSDLVLQTRKQKFGFSKPEQFAVLRRIHDVKKSLQDIEADQIELEIITANHLAHVLGNSITTFAGGLARRYEDGKYFSTDTHFVELPIEKIAMAKKEMALMAYYLDELSRDRELLIEEMESSIGALKNYLEFLSCDLPTQTVEQLKLFKFFIDLDKGRVGRDNFFEAIQGIENYLDVEKIREHRFDSTATGVPSEVGAE